MISLRSQQSVLASAVKMDVGKGGMWLCTGGMTHLKCATSAREDPPQNTDVLLPH